MVTGKFNIAVLISVFLVFMSAHAQEQSWNLNFKGGILLPGTVTVSPPGVDLDTDMGFLLQSNFDAMVAPKLSMGGRVVYANTSESESGEGANVLSLGGVVKGRFVLQSGWQLRPGVAFAYQMISGDVFDDVSGLDVGLVFEIVKPLENNRAVLGDIGFITQPAGGNSDADVTFGPLFYLLIGYEFGG